MSENGDHDEEEEVGHSSDDFFDHDPCKQKKIEVRLVLQSGNLNNGRSKGTLMEPCFRLTAHRSRLTLVANIPHGTEKALSVVLSLRDSPWGKRTFDQLSKTYWET